MRRIFAALLIACPGWSLATLLSQTTSDPGFDVQQVAPGVYAIIRTDPPGLIRTSNAVFIVNADDVVVVDTTGTPTTARATLEALRRLTPKPVSHVINTHWHDDHTLGNGVFRDAFKNAQFIGHAGNAAQVKAAGATARRQMVEIMPLLIKEFRLSIEQSKSRLGGPLSDEERRSHLGDIAASERYASEIAGVAEVTPTLTVSDRLTLVRGKRVIDVIHFGAGHTSEDLVVHLPQERVAVTGDLVVSPIPLLGATSHPADFAATLDKLALLQPAVLIPGHGPVLKNLDYVKLEARLFTSLAEQVSAGLKSGSTLPQLRKSVSLTDFEKTFAGDSALLRILFDFQVRSPGISAAFRHATK
jgi:cyclase